MSRIRGLCLLLLLVLMAVPLVGCSNTVQPASTAYRFLLRDQELRRMWQYNTTRVGQSMIAAHFSAPAGQEITFQGSLAREIKGTEGSEALLFGPGLYPFQLSEISESYAGLCGAMLVVNVDETVALATFGKAAETKLFSDEFIRKARKGILTNYTITFDGKPRIIYWLGNRRSPSPPGHATMELNFAGTPDLCEIKTGSGRVEGTVAVLDVYSSFRDQNTGQTRTVTRQHRLDIILTNNRKYTGYVRSMTPNAFTTFAQLPCAIPADLFAAADKGTISKFTVHPEGEERVTVAEVVFGRDYR